MTDVVRTSSRPGMPEGVPAVPNPPATDRTTFRQLAWPNGLAELSALGNVANEADGIPSRSTPEDLANWYSATPHFDPERDILVATVGGRMVAATIGGWEAANDGGRDYMAWGFVHPEWRRRGLGGALLRWMEARQRQVAAGHDSGVAKRLESWSLVQEAGRNALLEANGYVPIRFWFDMERPHLDDVPDAPLPQGFEFRPAREEDTREAWEVEIAAFRDHFGGMDTSEEAYLQSLKNPNLDLRNWVLVWHEGRIVGIALNRIKRAENELLGIQRGLVISVAVLSGYRRLGLGRAIVAESLRPLTRAPLPTPRLAVDAEHPHGAPGPYQPRRFHRVERGRRCRQPPKRL